MRHDEFKWWLAGLITAHMSTSKRDTLVFSQHKNGSWKFSLKIKANASQQFNQNQVDILELIKKGVGRGTINKLYIKEKELSDSGSGMPPSIDYYVYQLKATGKDDKTGKNAERLLEVLNELLTENCFITGYAFIYVSYFYQALKFKVDFDNVNGHDQSQKSLAEKSIQNKEKEPEKKKKIEVIYKDMLHDLEKFKQNKLSEIKLEGKLFSDNEAEIKDYFKSNLNLVWVGGYLSMKRTVIIYNISTSQARFTTLKWFKFYLTNTDIYANSRLDLYHIIGISQKTGKSPLQVTKKEELKTLIKTLRSLPIFGIQKNALDIWSRAYDTVIAWQDELNAQCEQNTHDRGADSRKIIKIKNNALRQEHAERCNHYLLNQEVKLKNLK